VTDIETIKAMLARAGIKFREGKFHPDVKYIEVENEGYYSDYGARFQFNADGSLFYVEGYKP